MLPTLLTTKQTPPKSIQSKLLSTINFRTGIEYLKLKKVTNLRAANNLTTFRCITHRHTHTGTQPKEFKNYIRLRERNTQQSHDRLMHLLSTPRYKEREWKDTMRKIDEYKELVVSRPSEPI